MFIRMICRSFTQERRRKKLAVLTVFLAAALITALMCVSIDIGDKMAREMKTYGANIVLAPKSESLSLEVGGINYNPLKGRVYLEEKELPGIMDIFWRNNIMGFAPYLHTRADVGGENGSIKSVKFVGTYLNKNIPLEDDPDYHTGVEQINTFWEVTGEWPQSAAQVLAGRELGYKTGETITLVSPENSAIRHKVTVSGILTSGDDRERAIIGDLLIAQDIMQLPGKIQSISVSALTVPEDELSRKAERDPDALSVYEHDIWYCTAYVSSIAHQLEEELAGTVARPVWQVAASEGAVIKKLQVLLLVVTIAAMVASSLGISSLMSSSIMERSREIGLVKALGADNSIIFKQFLAESSLIGVMGGLLGFLAGVLLAQFIGYTLFGSAVGFSWIILPVVVVAAVLVSVLGTLLPCRLIARLDPAEVLHGRQ